MTMRLRGRLRTLLLVLGPGLVTGFADNDAGGITTYSLAGAQYGFGLMWVLLVTAIALTITQEVGARIGLATGQGLGGVLREKFGVRWTGFAVVTMLIGNLGTTVAEFAGIAAALGLFGVPPQLSAVLSAALIVMLLSSGSFGRIQYLFVAVGMLVSAAYAVSAYLAHPDWTHAARSLVVPEITWTSAYLLTLVGVVGTTITPWGQGLIQSYMADKGLGPRDLLPVRIDVTLGSGLFTNLVAAFIVVACAATIWTTGGTINDAADAARALGPLAGPVATILFAVGLFAASLLGLGTVPLSSAYFACEAFGWESGLHWRWGQAPVFYGLLTLFIAVGALFTVIPGLPLIEIMFLSQVLNGLLLPIILVFVMRLSREPGLGDLKSGPALYALGWIVTGLASLMSIAFVISLFVGS
ncbi:MAG: divalent metal cation transporter [Chloroflexota bacterium]|nr:divalent metal cation transporter [Chloroflexota bacterium]MDE3192992.1 divalent metal cation transporter [Chloroflexota bacterium]